jgi:glycosyltransferase involved in cell wall biosynthesis
MSTDTLDHMPTQGFADEHTLLIYAPVPLYASPNGYLMEDQACNGLIRWSENFKHVIVMHPVEHGTPPASWIPLETSGIDLQRVEIVPLPTAYRPDQFLRQYRATRRRIAALIDRAHYLSFSIGGLFGDWGAVAALEAHRKQRRFAVWTDRVESEVVRHQAQAAKHWLARLRAALSHRPMAMLERAVIRRAALGLFHGAETYATYAPYAKVAEIVHDIHLRVQDRIPPQALQAKVAAADQGPLRICYLGRAEAMKGPQDWIEVMALLKAKGVDFQATWFGAGDQLETMKAQVAERGLQQCVSLPGFLRDRGAILDALREAQVFVFCHKTPESPRNLIEALVSGTPIVGYDSAFPRDLISAHGGGVLTPIHDPAALAATLAALAADRQRLGGLFQKAASDGEPFNDVAVFAHRSEVIREYL